MNIRRKTALTFLIALGGILLTLGTASRLILVSGFEKIEHESALRDMERATNALSSQLASLQASARDYASWDDTYRFMAEPWAGYVEANYIKATLANLRVNFVLLAQPDGQTAFSIGYDPEAGGIVPLPPDLIEVLQSKEVLPANGTEIEPRTGVALLAQGPALVAGEPILASTGAGPARGLLLMGRFLDKGLVKDLASSTLLDIGVRPAGAAHGPPEPRAAGKMASAPTIAPLSDDILLIKTTIFDMAGAPAMSLSVTKDRNTYRNALDSLNYFVAFLALAGAAFFFIAGLVLERSVLQRIAGLSQTVGEIRHSKDITKRTHMTGTDEITALSGEINSMLDGLEQLDLAHRRIADELRAAKEATEKASRAKGIFLANMSHEIRTPMNAIIGLSELALASDQPDKLHEYVQDIHTSSLTLLELINDILDISKIEAGGLVLEAAPFDLRDVVRRTANMFRERMAAKGLRFLVEVDPATPALLVGDAMRTQQVLSNLVSNACKFTEMGEVDMSVTVTAANNGSATLRLAVRDTGIGVAPAVQERIFTPFMQGDSSTTRKYGGTGLGLAISRDIVTKMGGTLEVESRPGKGSVFSFTVTLPLATETRECEAPAPVVDTSALAGAKILLAEDNAFNRKVAVDMLQGMGLTVTTAGTGTEAILALYQDDFDAVFMDMRMPEMDGLEATRVIRSEARFRPVPIIALTADALEGDRKTCLAAGMDDYLAKPVSRSRLAATLARWIAPGKRTQRAPAPQFKNAVPDTPEEFAGLEGMDVAKGLAMFNGDAQALKDAILRFPAHFVDTVSQIRRAMSHDDRKEASRLAHSLKGAAAQIGAEKIMLTARGVERTAETADVSLIMSMLVSLEQAMVGLVNSILAFTQSSRPPGPQS